MSSGKAQAATQGSSGGGDLAEPIVSGLEQELTRDRDESERGRGCGTNIKGAGQEESSDAELASSLLVMDSCPPENLLQTGESAVDRNKRSSQVQHWQRKLGRMRTDKLVIDSIETEDALSIYSSRLSLLAVMQVDYPGRSFHFHTANFDSDSKLRQGAPRHALDLDVDSLMTLLRRLFRTVRPEVGLLRGGQNDWQAQLKHKVLRGQLGIKELSEERGRESVIKVADHCCRLLESMALRAASPPYAGRSGIKRICIETKHGYTPNTRLAVRIVVPDAASLKVTFDPRSSTKRGKDVLSLFSDPLMKNPIGSTLHGPAGSPNWSPPPLIKGQALTLHFESDEGLAEWGFRMFIVPLDAAGNAMSATCAWFESVPGMPHSTRGKYDVSLQQVKIIFDRASPFWLPVQEKTLKRLLTIALSQDVPMGGNGFAGGSGLLLTFDRKSCAAVPGGRWGGRCHLKFSSSAGKVSYQGGSYWKPLLMPRTLTFTMQAKGSASGSPAAEGGGSLLDFRFMLEILSAEAGGDAETGIPSEGQQQGTFATDEAGEMGGVVGTSDTAFLCWLITALCSPSDGLLHTCGADKARVEEQLARIVASCLRACLSIPIPQKAGMLHSLAIAGRGLDLSRVPLSKESSDAIRALREAAIAQHALEQPLVGSQRAQFSSYLQALVEAVAVLDTGPVEDFSLMSHSELLRSIESVDGPPGAGLARAALSGSEEQLTWCLCRGARPEAPCPERLVHSFPAPHFVLHYAAHGGHAHIITKLFERRADLHCVDGDGNRPLAWAAQKGQLKAVEELLRLGADPRHRNNKGKTALALTATVVGSQIDGGAWSSAARRGGDHRGVVTLLESLDPDSQVLRIPGLVMACQGGYCLPHPDGPDTLPDVHQHPLQRTQRTTEWRCDGCSSPGRGSRFRCTGAGCDFDLCQQCWDASRRFTWGDVRGGHHSKHFMRAVANSKSSPLPDAWQHTSWMPSSAHRRNGSQGCGFHYLNFDGGVMLQSSSAMNVGTVIVVVRAVCSSSDTAHSILSIGPRTVGHTEARWSHPRSGNSNASSPPTSSTHTSSAAATAAAAAAVAAAAAAAATVPDDGASPMSGLARHPGEMPPHPRADPRSPHLPQRDNALARISREYRRNMAPAQADAEEPGSGPALNLTPGALHLSSRMSSGRASASSGGGRRESPGSRRRSSRSALASAAAAADGANEAAEEDGDGGVDGEGRGGDGEGEAGVEEGEGEGEREGAEESGEGGGGGDGEGEGERGEGDDVDQGLVGGLTTRSGRSARVLSSAVRGDDDRPTSHARLISSTSGNTGRSRHNPDLGMLRELPRFDLSGSQPSGSPDPTSSSPSTSYAPRSAGLSGDARRSEARVGQMRSGSGADSGAAGSVGQGGSYSMGTARAAGDAAGGGGQSGASRWCQLESGGGGEGSSADALAGDAGVLGEGGHGGAYASTCRGCFSSWGGIWRSGEGSDGGLHAVESEANLHKSFDGRWQILILETKGLVNGHVHLMGGRSGRKKAKGDVADFYVFDRALTQAEKESATAHLRLKFRLDAPSPEALEPPSKIPKDLLVRRMRELCASAPMDARLEIPRWLDRYIKCFQVVDSLITSSPLPKWFRREIEPGGSEPWNPNAPSVGGTGTSAQLVEALFDASKCGSGASLDATRTRVEFTGMVSPRHPAILTSLNLSPTLYFHATLRLLLHLSLFLVSISFYKLSLYGNFYSRFAVSFCFNEQATVLFTEAIPSEGLHIMEFDVLGRDQCLLGVGTPDVDVETYLGHKRGGYGFFASEGTLKVDGDWKGGHGLCKFKRGDKVGVHVDMSRRTLQFSVSHWEVDSANGQGSWRKTLLERIVEGLPSVLHFAVGGAAGGEISIAVSANPATHRHRRLS